MSPTDEPTADAYYDDSDSKVEELDLSFLDEEDNASPSEDQ
jgi:hypothetical protein